MPVRPPDRTSAHLHPVKAGEGTITVRGLRAWPWMAPITNPPSVLRIVPASCRAWKTGAPAKAQDWPVTEAHPPWADQSGRADNCFFASHTATGEEAAGWERVNSPAPRRI